MIEFCGDCRHAHLPEGTDLEQYPDSYQRLGVFTRSSVHWDFLVTRFYRVLCTLLRASVTERILRF